MTATNPECIAFIIIKSLLAPLKIANQRKGQNTPISTMFLPVFMFLLSVINLGLGACFLVELGFTAFTHFLPNKV